MTRALIAVKEPTWMSGFWCSANLLFGLLNHGWLSRFNLVIGVLLLALKLASEWARRRAAA